MVDFISSGFRTGAPPADPKAPEAQSHTPPLSTTFALMLLVGTLVPLLFIAFINLPLFGIPVNVYVVLLVWGAWAGGVYALFHYFCMRPLLTLSSWLQQARTNGFLKVAPAPADSSREIDQVRDEVREALGAFLQSQEQVRDLLAHKDETISLIEHQLRTPLTGLKWSLENVAVPEEVRTSLFRIDITIQDIINAARIGDGKFGYVFADVDIVPLVKDLITKFKPWADSRGVSLALADAIGVPHVQADADRIGFALSNIISNAIEYTHQGGSVTISMTLIGQYLEISIVDTGIGMPQEDLSNLFVKMYRGKNAMKMRPDGSGLGLYVTRNILNAHNASVAVRSEEGKGTQFSFRLPLKENPTATPAK